MKHGLNCKFCKAPIIVEIDDAYDLSDPHKLFHFAACNHCADLRVKRRGLEQAIERSAMTVAQGCGNDTKNKCRELLIILTKKYTSLIAEWVKATAPWWEQEIVDTIMEHPSQWTQALGLCWNMYEEKR